MAHEDRCSVKIVRLDPKSICKGCGPRRAEQFAEHGIRTVGDLSVTCLFDTRQDAVPFHLQPARRGVGTHAGRIAGIGGFEGRRRRISVVEILVRMRPAACGLKFFNSTYLRSVFKPGLDLIILRPGSAILAPTGPWC